MAQTISILFLGDIVGQSGYRALFAGLNGLKKKHGAELVIANGENVSDGFGISPETAMKLFSNGIDVITSGNHIWQKQELLPLLDREERLLRPVNYPPKDPGHGYCIVQSRATAVAVINAQGRMRMWSLDCPFRKTQEIVRKVQSEAKIVIVDFHAEATDEKEAFAHYFDGRVGAVIGTHTHTQTADERLLPKGTAYITDAGMTGPRDSVIGFNPEISVQRMLTQMPLKNEVSENTACIQGVTISFDRETGKALSIERVCEYSSV